ncbi:MAG: 2-C-methyl-D-erythritol 4-phosphate cytidylyltransferase [Bacteroidota bacterium]
MIQKTVIITAGGLGKRMNSELPKQFLKIHNKTILEHTISCFSNYDSEIQIVLTLPQEWIEFWQKSCLETDFTVSHEIISGGKERYHSIKNALSFAKGDLIAIHDGVRPMVSKETIQKAFDLAQENGNAIPVFPVKESIRFVENEETKALDRKNHFIVQTPQVFQKEIILKAYENEFHDKITDDASLVEEMGEKIHVFEGNEENIKITTKFDLILMKEVLSYKF